jgi:L-2,4-diaminobutyric acid acetyltransferase
MVYDLGALDVNSCYAYLLLCEHFRDTCLVAEPADAAAAAKRGLAAFVAAFRPPNRPEAVFVWQIGVARWAQKRGLAKQLLLELIDLPGCRDAQFMEATVAPSNLASQCLFASVADEIGVAIECIEGFVTSDFDNPSNAAHEPEPLYRIGPLPAQQTHSEES